VCRVGCGAGRESRHGFVRYLTGMVVLTTSCWTSQIHRRYLQTQTRQWCGRARTTGVCVRACVHACVRACVCECVRLCVGCVVCVRASVSVPAATTAVSPCLCVAVVCRAVHTSARATTYRSPCCRSLCVHRRAHAATVVAPSSCLSRCGARVPGKGVSVCVFSCGGRLQGTWWSHSLGAPPFDVRHHLLSLHNGDDVIVVQRDDNSVDYAALMQSSRFCLVPRGGVM
jgi:hypothetical protein